MMNLLDTCVNQYVNMPLQYTAIFQMKMGDIFVLFKTKNQTVDTHDLKQKKENNVYLSKLEV